jgi:hypothetical protein
MGQALSSLLLIFSASVHDFPNLRSEKLHLVRSSRWYKKGKGEKNADSYRYKKIIH